MPEDRKALKEAAIGAQGRWSERPLSEATLYEFDIPATVISLLAALEEAEGRERRLREELERSAEGWANAIELGLIPPQHVKSAEILRDGARAALSDQEA